MGCAYFPIGNTKKSSLFTVVLLTILICIYFFVNAFCMLTGIVVIYCAKSLGKTLWIIQLVIYVITFIPSRIYIKSLAIMSQVRHQVHYSIFLMVIDQYFLFIYARHWRFEYVQARRGRARTCHHVLHV